MSIFYVFKASLIYRSLLFDITTVFTAVHIARECVLIGRYYKLFIASIAHICHTMLPVLQKLFWILVYFRNHLDSFITFQTYIWCLHADEASIYVVKGCDWLCVTFFTDTINLFLLEAVHSYLFFGPCCCPRKIFIQKSFLSLRP